MPWQSWLTWSPQLRAVAFYSLEGLPQNLQRMGSFGQEFGTTRRKFQSRCIAYKKRHTKMRSQPLDLLADGSLGNKQLLGSQFENAKPCRSFKGP